MKHAYTYISLYISSRTRTKMRISIRRLSIDLFQERKAECPWLRIDLVCPGPIDTAFHKNDQNPQESPKGTSRREMKMPSSRCAKLMVSSFLMKGGGEHWIAEQPSLSALYIKQFFPNAFQKILCKVGPLRIKAWKQGLNLYDPQTWKDIRKKS